MIDLEKEQLSSELRGSFLRFVQVFYPLLTGRDFIIPNPPGRESHVITIAKALTRAARLEIPSHRLWISVPPGHGKSTMLVFWVAWCMAQYPDSKFLYISYSVSLASKHTETIKRIIQLPHYKYLFDVSIRHDARGKEFFQTTEGGAVAAFGSTGSIVGTDAGLPGLDRMTGALVLDDLHKIDEAHSDTMRNSVINNYRETIQQRGRGINVPYIGIGQRVHEEDVANFLLNGNDGYEWEHILLPALDAAGNPLYPEAFPLPMLKKKQEFDPYVFASQYQQDPIPAGGALFKPEWFVQLDELPEITGTFITADTAETNKSWNDATVFSFWGLYEIVTFGKKTGELGLHWLDCVELRIEPKDLRNHFIDFWQDCATFKVPPLIAAIEKKSTGTTLLSVLEEFRGLQVRAIERNRSSGSKTQRFLEIQPYVASKRISISENAKHKDLVLNHMSKITANESHRHDDICHVAGSKIATTKGYKNIEDITINDRIITPFGIGKVIEAKCTGYSTVIKKINLISTPDHKVFTYNNGFARLDTIADDDKLDKLSFMGLLQWKFLKLLLSMELTIDSWDRDVIILASQRKEIGKALRACMWQFGSFIASKRFQKALSFIIKTMIVLITTMKIWIVFRGNNILKNIKKIFFDGIIVTKEKNILSLFKKRLKNGIKVKKAGHGIQKTQKNVLKKYFMKGSLFVFNVAKNLLIKTLQAPLFAVNCAKVDIDDLSSNHLLANVSFVKMNLQPKIQLQDQEDERHVLINASTYLKDDQFEIKPVYSITVEQYGVYYCNDILVSNCDTIADAIKIALIDKTLNLSLKSSQNSDLAARIMKGNAQIYQTRTSLHGYSS